MNNKVMLGLVVLILVAFNVYADNISKADSGDNISESNITSNINQIKEKQTEQTQLETTKTSDFAMQRVSIIIPLLFTALIFLISSALSVFLNAAEKYTPRIRDLLRKYLFFVILSFIFFSACFIFVTKTVNLPFEWILYPYLLVIALWLLWVMRVFLNTLSYEKVLKGLEKDIIKEISNTASKMKKEIKIKRKKDPSRELYKMPFYQHILFGQKYTLDKPKRNTILDISYIISKAIKREDVDLVEECLDSINNICDKYINSRKNYIFVQDLFLQFIFEELEQLSKSAILSENRHMIDSFIRCSRNIGLSTLKIETVGIQTVDNSNLLASRFLELIGIKCLEKKLYNLVKDSILGLKELGIKSLETKKNDALASNNIKNIVDKTNDWFIIHHAIASYLYLIKKSIEEKIVWMSTNNIIDNLEKACIKSIILKNDRNCLLGPLYGFGEVSLEVLFKSIMSLRPKKEIATANLEENSTHIINRLLKLVKMLGDLHLKTKSACLYSHIDYLSKIKNTLNMAEFKTKKGGFKEEIKKLDKEKEKLKK